MTIATLSTSVQQCINNFTAALIRNKTLILQCIGFTFLWGFTAYGFMFVNGNISHDMLREFMLLSNIKLSAGRIFVPLYTTCVRGIISAPWLVALIGLLYIAIASCLLAKIFQVHSKLYIAFFTGLLTVNVSNISLVTSYIHDFDVDMMAMLCAVFAAYCWNRSKNGWWFGVLPIVFSLGLYQSFVSTTITLVIFVCIMDLLAGDTFEDVLWKGLRGVLMILCAGLLYYCSLKISYLITGVALHSGSGNSLDTILHTSPSEIGQTILHAYTRTINVILFFPTLLYKGGIVFMVYIIAVLCGIIALCRICYLKKLHMKEMSLLAVLLLVLPWGMNVAFILTNGNSYDLMHYALWFTSILILLFVEQVGKEQQSLFYWCKPVSLCVLTILLWWNIRLANDACVVKDLEYDARLSLFTRITADLEEMEGYSPGETKVALVGLPDDLLQDLPEYNRIRMLRSMHKSLPFLHNSDYFKYVLMNSAAVISDGEANNISRNSAVQAMPLYPASGSMQYVNDTLVVKLGVKLWE